MSSFSDVYNFIVQDREVRVYDMARSCQIAPQSLYQIINGKRKPTSRTLVEKMAEYLQLTPSQTHALLESYAITQIGLPAFNRRSMVQNFLNSYCDRELETPSVPVELYIEQDSLPNPFVTANRIQITGLLYSLIVHSSGHVQMFLPVNFPDLKDILLAASDHVSVLQTEQIVCINGAPDSHEQVFSIVEILEKVIPLYVRLENYTAYSYYDNCDFSMLAFPFYAVSSVGVLLINSSFDHAVYLHDQESIQTWSRFFEKLKKETRPFLIPFSDPLEQMDFLADINASLSGKSYLFHPDFCPSPYLDSRLISAHVSLDAFGNDVQGYHALLEMFRRHSGGLYQLWTAKDIDFITSEEGIRRFMESGEAEDYPSDVYTPLTPSERIILLERMIASIPDIQYRMLRPDSVLRPSRIEVQVTDTKGYVVFRDNRQRAVFLIINNELLLSLFKDYFSTLSEDLFCSQEEMLQTLQNLVEEYRQRFLGPGS